MRTVEPATADALADDGRAAGCVLLIAEPEPMVARILAHKLRREGHDIVVRHDVDAAVSELSDIDIALIACEPGDGVAEKLTRARAPRCGWFALIDSRDGESALAAMHAGAAGVVRKPFKPTEVAAQVATLLRIADR